jgi:thioredoxin 1
MPAASSKEAVMRQAMYAVSLSAIFVATLGAGRAAHAQVHFTTPPPGFEQALASAKQQGKPLLLEFSTTWCGPCKQLARDLRKPRGRPLLEQVHLVVYNGEEEPGMALMQKFGISGYPSLVAVDSSGEEASRRSGYGRFIDFEEWVKGLPEQAVPLEAHKRAADGAPQNGKLQMSLGSRLLKLDRHAEAQTYFQRAQKAGPKEVAAQAAWTLLQIAAREQQQKSMRKAAEQLVVDFPGSKEAGRALRFLAALPNPGQGAAASLEPLFLKHLQEAKDTTSLQSLAFAAMKAGAMKAAVKVAEKLAFLSKGQPAHLDVQAEVAFYAEGRTDKAIPLAERAVAAASVEDKPRFTANLERFRRDKREPSSELSKFTVPSLELPAVERASMLPQSVKLRRALQKTIRESCWQLTGSGLESFEIVVLSSSKPSEHRPLYPSGTPPLLAACATKIIQAAELPPDDIVTLTAELVPLSVEEQLEEHIGTAEETCTGQAGKTRSVRAVLTAESGQPAALQFPSTPADKALPRELRACIEKSFATWKPARPLLKSVSFYFSSEE